MKLPRESPDGEKTEDLGRILWERVTRNGRERRPDARDLENKEET